MACYHPLVAHHNPASGVVSFVELKRHGDTRQILIPCGKCIGCRLQRANDWALRCKHEAAMHEHNAYITLTWSEETLQTPTLCHRDWQLFAKRLRKALISEKFANQIHVSESLYYTPIKGSNVTMGLRPIPQLKIYMCGEYGEEGRRPHFHACLFGIDFADKKAHSRNKFNDTLYTSETLDRIWGNGHATIGAVTYESAAYIARYIMGKITGDAADAHYQHITEDGEIIQLKPEYNQMSRAEAIGKRWLMKYESDVYPHGTVRNRGKIVKAPKIYDRIFKSKAPTLYRDMKEQREQEAYNQREDNTDKRLATKEVIKAVQLSQLRRGKI